MFAYRKVLDQRVPNTCTTQVLVLNVTRAFDNAVRAYK